MPYHPILIPAAIFLISASLFAVTVFLVIRSSWNRRARPPTPVPMLRLTNQGRAAALARAGETLRMRFEESVPQEAVENLQPFVLFSRGVRRTIYNRLIGSRADCRIEVFDYVFDSGAGGSPDKGGISSIVLLKAQTAAFPQFDLRPTTPSEVSHGGLGQWRPLARLFGMARRLDESLLGTIPAQIKDLERVESGEGRRFSELYLVHAADPEAVSPLFTDEVVSYFERHPAVHVECRDGTMVYWRGDQMLGGDPRRWLGSAHVSASDLRDLIGEALEVFRIFARHQGKR